MFPNGRPEIQKIFQDVTLDRFHGDFPGLPSDGGTQRASGDCVEAFELFTAQPLASTELMGLDDV